MHLAVAAAWKQTTATKWPEAVVAGDCIAQEKWPRWPTPPAQRSADKPRCPDDNGHEIRAVMGREPTATDGAVREAATTASCGYSPELSRRAGSPGP